MKPISKWINLLGLTGLVLVLVGSWIGLFVAPAERFMGDVQRIMYVHVPTAWNAMLGYTFAFAFAVASLWTSRPKWDSAVTATIEVSLLP